MIYGKLHTGLLFTLGLHISSARHSEVRNGFNIRFDVQVLYAQLGHRVLLSLLDLPLTMYGPSPPTAHPIYHLKLWCYHLNSYQK